MTKALALVWLLATSATPTAWAADLTAEQVHEILSRAAPDQPADLSRKSLENLDLSNFDFRSANLSGADLFGAKLVGADFSHADLSGAKLDLAWVMRANFTNANLSNASLLSLVVSSGLDYSAAEAPIFKGADFSGAHILARLSRFDLSNANFTAARLGADLKNQSMGLMRSDLSGANLAGAAHQPCVAGDVAAPAQPGRRQCAEGDFGRLGRTRGGGQRDRRHHCRRRKPAHYRIDHVIPLPMPHPASLPGSPGLPKAVLALFRQGACHLA